MKNISISLLAGWITSIRSFVNGDLNIEGNYDLWVGDIADRLGYLKAQLALVPYLAANNTMTGTTTISGATGGLVVTGDNGTTLSDLTCTGTAAFDDEVDLNGSVICSSAVEMDSGSTIREFTATQADAPTTLGATGHHFRVPILTVNRVYTLPTTTADRRVFRITKAHVDAFTLTVKNPAAATVAVLGFAASNGWVEVQDTASGWVIIGWGGDVTSMLGTV